MYLEIDTQLHTIIDFQAYFRQQRITTNSKVIVITVQNLQKMILQQRKSFHFLGNLSPQE